jgi:hypothetical protein
MCKCFAHFLLDFEFSIDEFLGILNFSIIFVDFSNLDLGPRRRLHSLKSVKVHGNHVMKNISRSAIKQWHGHARCG